MMSLSEGMTLLSPTLIDSILNGTQPEWLTMKWLTRNTFPSDWEEQSQLSAIIR